MTTSTLLATWLPKSTTPRTLTFNFKLKRSKDLLSRYGGSISAGHSSLRIQSSLSVQPSLSPLSFFLSNFLGELKNFAEFFLILFIMFCTKQSHCLTQLFKNVKLTQYSKRWYVVCQICLKNFIHFHPFLNYYVMCTYLTKEICNQNYFIVNILTKVFPFSLKPSSEIYLILICGLI